MTKTIAPSASRMTAGAPDQPKAANPSAPHERWLNQKCQRCGSTRREHIWTNICPASEPTQWFKEQP